MQNSTLLIRKRIATLFFLFAFAFLLLSGRLFWIQLVKGEELSQKAVANRLRDVPLEAKRGIIYDRNGKELALSIRADSIYAVPTEIRSADQAEETAAQLARILSLEKDTIRERITRHSSFEWIQRQVEPEKGQAIRELKLSGIGITEEYRRYYPKDTLAAHILGIAGTDNTGLEGIEFFYNDLVGGTPGRVVIEFDAFGREIPEAVHRHIPAVEGKNIYLTIDETIQYIAEREIDKTFRNRQAVAATVIVMDPHSGEILALASRPTFDPNHFNAFPAENRKNYALNEVYEPGSTFKIITAAMALEEGVVHPGSTLQCGGTIKVGVETLGCPNQRAHGSQTLVQAVGSSCNVAHIKIAQALGQETFFQYLHAFGFGRPTGIDLPGEAKGILVPRDQARSIDLATMSIGQANAVTPLQLLTAVSAVANGGELMQPYLLRKAVDEKGEIVMQGEPQVANKVISRETAAELASILEKAVTQGTGEQAYIEGYPVAGKTGTAQKIASSGGYLLNEFVASFVGFAPADDPRLACIVVVDNPKGYPYYGGWVAAPVLQEVLKEALAYLEVPLRGVQEDNSARAQSRVLVPDVINLPRNEAINRVNKTGLKAQVTEDGGKVWQQIPAAHTLQDPGTTVMLYLAPLNHNPETGIITIPDLKGQSMWEAARILEELGLYLHPEGFGIAYRQFPDAGSILSHGSIIKVYFQPREE